MLPGSANRLLFENRDTARIKIDRSFVATMHSHSSSSSIVRATIGLGKSLGLTIVAEGVETEAQLSDLRRWGCDQVQGYLIGKPAACAVIAAKRRHRGPA